MAVACLTVESAMTTAGISGWRIAKPFASAKKAASFGTGLSPKMISPLDVIVTPRVEASGLLSADAADGGPTGLSAVPSAGVGSTEDSALVGAVIAALGCAASLVAEGGDDAQLQTKKRMVATVDERESFMASHPNSKGTALSVGAEYVRIGT
jgi:hypothetical protein